MSAVSQPDLTELPLPLAKQINQICNRFEAAWKRGQRPRLEDFLHEIGETDRWNVERELVLLEIAYRKRAGELLDVAEYGARFPALNKDLLEQEIVGDKTPRHIGRYSVEKELGRGSFGVVYLARDEQLQRSVAIKVPHRQFVSRPEEAGPYLTEARTVANLDHPNIVPVHDFGSNEDFPCFIVSKYVEGSTLYQKTRNLRPSIGEAAAMVATIAKALHHAHIKGLVHRDITPGNIMIDQSGQPFVVDFGLALKDENIGRGPHYAGTPLYMSPEQARGEGHRVDGRSDIFSLGVVFYELITGRRPFRGDARDVLLEQIATLEARPPRQINDAIPKEIERICLKALSKRATERYSTALDLAEELEGWLAGSEHRQTAKPDKSGRQKILPKGLRSYDAHDASFFLDLLPGPRDRDGLPEGIRFWKTRIEETGADTTFNVGLIYGPSGCGKSSLMKAGLLPQLADNVIAVYVEATAEETERHLLVKLRQRCPALPSKLTLKKTLAMLRSGQAISMHKKVLIVLDQFEQWLHAKKDEEPTELVQALRQCDGARLQCIVMVRDDFWMAATRFMQELEIRFVDGQNSAAVDLFPVKHAESVLSAFGRAFGTLPECSALDKDHKQFLEQAIRGLSQEGKVICIRLALFAEMMKGITWTPSALKEVGGTEGVGVAFLKSTFNAPTAPSKIAARSVLKSLLPETGTDIRGHMRSRVELLDASGYGNRPKEFDALIRVLDSELRLITPTERDGKEGVFDSVSEVQPREKYYQLTHDYLVHSLRDWLTREQKETKRGRAELLLADRATVWNDRPENRQFPSLLQWIQVRLLTSRKYWTSPQRKMMRAAVRYHMRRVLTLGACLILLGLVGWDAFGHWQASMLRDRLLTSKTTDVPEIVKEIAPYRRWIDPLLRKLYLRSKERNAFGTQLNAALALLPMDSSHMDYLCERLLKEEPPEVNVIREALLDHGQTLAERLWTILENPKNDQKERFGAACALARYDPSNPRWEKIGADVAAMLVTQNQFLMAEWTDAFKPVGKWLVPPLASFLQNEEHGSIRLIARVYGTYAADVADAYARLEKQLDEKLPIDDLEGRAVLAKKQANIASALLLIGRPQRVWPLLKHESDPTLRSFLIERIGPNGVDPQLVTERLEFETDVSVKLAILLSLGDIGLDRLPLTERQNLMFGLLKRYWYDPDPGVHGAAHWLLKKWQAHDKIREFERNVAAENASVNRQWHINSQGHTMIEIINPREFWMGDGKREVKHRRKVGRNFAIATTQVTLGQFRRFRETHEVNQGFAPNADCPVYNVTWYAAAEYCNWLSKLEGIAEHQWCYLPNPAGKYADGMKMAPDHLRRRGYRLPTEAEWEYACRAGAETACFFGVPSEELLSKYAWYTFNSSITTHSVGLLKPNDLGLFDINGNVWVWTENAMKPYDNSVDGKLLLDDEGDTEIHDKQVLVVRGGAYDSFYFWLTSARRLNFNPNNGRNVTGFRLVRTLSVE